MDKVRVGIIGLGMVFRLGYLKWLKGYLLKNPWIKLTALADNNEGLLKKYAERFDCKAYKDAGELLEKEAIEAVIICTPTWTHRELVLKAARRGIHVLCEKPMAATVQECDDMIAACRDAGVLLRMSLMRRFNLGFQRIREMVRAGQLGEIIEINMEWPAFIPPLDESPYRETISWIGRYLKVDVPRRFGAWRLKDRRMGGGNFLDHGPHSIDLFRWIVDDVSAVSAVSRVIVEGRNEDFTKCTLRFASGAMGYITTTLYDLKFGPWVKAFGFVRGTRGRIDFNLPDPVHFKPIRYITVYKEPSSTWMKIIRGTGLFRASRIRLPGNFVFMDQMDYFLSSVAGKRGVHPLFEDEDFAAKGEDGRYATHVVQLAYESARNNAKWIPVEL